MSKEEQNIKFTNTSNESISKKDIIPTKTSQSINTESYEYFNQKTSSKKDITESPFSLLNQQSNSRYSSNNKNSNSKFISRKIISGKTQSVQGNVNLSGLKCTCNHSNEKFLNSDLEYSSSLKKGENCKCDTFKKQLFEQNSGNKSGKDNYENQFINQQKI